MQRRVARVVVASVRVPRGRPPMLHIAFCVASSYIHVWVHGRPVRPQETTSFFSEVEAPAMAVSGVGDRRGFDRRLEWLGAWSGIAWVVVCGGGFFGSGLVPVWAASTKPKELAAHLADIKYQILIGMLLVLIGGLTFLITWSLTLAYQIRKYANPSPLAFAVLAAVGLTG